MKRKYFPCTFLLLALAACNYPQPEAATLNPQEIGTYAAQTAVILMGTESAGQKTVAVVDNAPPAATPTATLQPTSTQTLIPTNPPPPPATAKPVRCNWARFETDVTIPDDTLIAAATGFAKTWRLENVGTCDWTSGYRMVFDHGDRMDAPDWMQLTTAVIKPGDTIDVTINLQSPAAHGTYQGYYKLRSPEGTLFGIGADANTAFWVRIKVA